MLMNLTLLVARMRIARLLRKMHSWLRAGLIKKCESFGARGALDFVVVRQLLFNYYCSLMTR